MCLVVSVYNVLMRVYFITNNYTLKFRIKTTRHNDVLILISAKCLGIKRQFYGEAYYPQTI